MRGIGFLRDRRLDRRQDIGLARFEHGAWAASSRLAGSGDISVRPPIAASMARRSRLLIPHHVEIGGAGTGERGAGRGVEQPAGGVLVKNLLLLGAVEQPAVLQRLEKRGCPRIAAFRQRHDAGVGLAKIVFGEMRKRFVEPGGTKRRRRHQRQECEHGEEAQNSGDQATLAERHHDFQALIEEAAEGRLRIGLQCPRSSPLIPA